MNTKQIKEVPGAFIAQTAYVCGNVKIGKKSSVWYNAVVRGDESPIEIGDRTNIQDGCILHVDRTHPVRIGDDVSVGHNAVIHGCTIGDNTLIGMGAIVLNEAVVGKNCIIGAGALVTQGTVIPDGSMAFGNPAKVRRPLTEEEIAGVKKNAEIYIELAEGHAGKAFED